MSVTRRSFLVSSILGLTAVPGYSRFLEPKWLDVTHKRVPLNPGKLGGEIRVLHLSDLHSSNVVPLELIDRAITLGLEERPHLACLTGDYVTVHLLEPDRYGRVLRRLGEAVPTFASFGNHDGGKWALRHSGFKDTRVLRSLLEQAGIVCLHNEHRRIEIGNSRLLMVGLGDLWSEDVRPEHAFPAPNAAQGSPALVLAHNPDTRHLARDYSWDLMLCGHTHGGQVVLPVINYAPFVPVNDRKYLEGLHSWEGRLIHVTRGVGNILGIRLNCRPEVSVLTLTA